MILSDRSLREEIRERERQESYGHIAAGIAHEVKNPLGGIRGAAELLTLSAQDDRGRKAANLIVDEVDRISGLVDELMVFARGDELELDSVNIHRPLDSLLDLLDRLNRDDAVDGILVQLPLPNHISPEAIAEAIDPAKDADALHPLNFGRLLLGNAQLISCTPLGVMAVLERHGVEIAG